MSNSKINICTWFYGESKGEESNYPQVVGVSSSTQFQAIYWRCIVVYFASSIKNNPTANHVLFTNVARIPDIDNFKTREFLDRHGIQIVQLPLTYQTPVGYYGLWRNQFYIFDIIKYLTNEINDINESYIILDSDCLWIKSCEKIEKEIEINGLLTYEINYAESHNINGLTRIDMGKIYGELDNKVDEDLPKYFGGEWFAANIENIKKVSLISDEMWEICLRRFEKNLPKFNEEAHLLSYIYHKLGYRAGTANSHIKRIWTAWQFFYNASAEDFSLDVWHMPAEKNFGIKRLFSQVCQPQSKFWKVPVGEEFAKYAAAYLGIPKASLLKIIMDWIEMKKSGLKRRLGLG